MLTQEDIYIFELQFLMETFDVSSFHELEVELLNVEIVDYH